MTKYQKLELEKKIYETKHFDEIMPIVFEALYSYANQKVEEDRKEIKKKLDLMFDLTPNTNDTTK